MEKHFMFMPQLNSQIIVYYVSNITRPYIDERPKYCS